MNEIMEGRKGQDIDFATIGLVAGIAVASLIIVFFGLTILTVISQRKLK